MSSEERAIKAYEVYAVESRQAEYYIMSAAGIALGFVLQQGFVLTGHRTDLLVPLSWILLLLSLVGGLWQLRIRVETLRLGSTQHQVRLQLEGMREGAFTTGQVFHKTTGEILSGEVLERTIAGVEDIKTGITARIDALGWKAALATRLRDWGLTAGVIAYALWKILPLLRILR